MSRFFIDLGYKGTNYSGLQKQKNASTIQEEVDNALATILKEKVETVTSSRTDAGVHCAHNFLHFNSNQLFRVDKLSYQLNAILSQDITIHNIRKVTDDAHSRFNATSRLYHYHIHQYKNPLVKEFSYFYPFPLDISRMNEACLLLLANEDFQSFSKKHTEVNSFICKLLKCQWIEDEQHKLRFVVEGNRFLRGMVRALVGTTLQLGRGRITLNEFEEIIQSKDCTQANFSAEAKGLILKEVTYPKELFL